MSRRPRFVAVLMLSLTFMVGSLTGMALEEAFGIDWFDFLDEDYDREGRLLSGLDLTDDQEERVDSILDEQEDLLEEYWEARLPDIQRILDRSYAEMRTILTPRQRAVFDRRVEELRGRAPGEVRD